MRGLIDATGKMLRYSQETEENQPTIYSAQTKLESGYRVGQVQLNGFRMQLIQQVSLTRGGAQETVFSFATSTR
jgi:hypothetical protein